jgi:uncharacterized protein YqcC (DUF446 family)
MNWYSVGAAAVAGALAAMVATLVVPKRAERKAAYAIVFVLLFSVFTALTREFVVPALTLPHELERAERELLTMPLFQALKQHDLATYNAFMAELKEGLKQGTKEADLIARLKPRMEQMVQKRVPVASDQAVVKYMSVMTREMRELRRQDPLLCYKFMFPQQYGAINIKDHVPKELMDADLAALTDVIKTSAEQPQPAPKQVEVAPDLDVAIGQLQQKHQEDVAVLQNLQAPEVDKAKGCEVTADLYEIIIALPPDRNGRLLRYLLSQG